MTETLSCKPFRDHKTVITDQLNFRGGEGEISGYLVITEGGIPRGENFTCEGAGIVHLQQLGGCQVLVCGEELSVLLNIKIRLRKDNFRKNQKQGK
jgi:hypothetical protein